MQNKIQISMKNLYPKFCDENKDISDFQLDICDNGLKWIPIFDNLYSPIKSYTGEI